MIYIWDYVFWIGVGVLYLVGLAKLALQEEDK